MKDWTLTESGDEIIIMHSTNSSTTVKKEGNDTIAEEILAKLAMDLMKSQDESSFNSAIRSAQKIVSQCTNVEASQDEMAVLIHTELDALIK